MVEYSSHDLISGSEKKASNALTLAFNTANRSEVVNFFFP